MIPSLSNLPLGQPTGAFVKSLTNLTSERNGVDASALREGSRKDPSKKKAAREVLDYFFDNAWAWYKAARGNRLPKTQPAFPKPKGGLTEDPVDNQDFVDAMRKYRHDWVHYYDSPEEKRKAKTAFNQAEAKRREDAEKAAQAATNQTVASARAAAAAAQAARPQWDLKIPAVVESFAHLGMQRDPSESRYYNPFADAVWRAINEEMEYTLLNKPVRYPLPDVKGANKALPVHLIDGQNIFQIIDGYDEEGAPDPHASQLSIKNWHPASQNRQCFFEPFKPGEPLPPKRRTWERGLDGKETRLRRLSGLQEEAMQVDAPPSGIGGPVTFRPDTANPPLDPENGLLAQCSDRWDASPDDCRGIVVVSYDYVVFAKLFEKYKRGKVDDARHDKIMQPWDDQGAFMKVLEPLMYPGSRAIFVTFDFWNSELLTGDVPPGALVKRYPGRTRNDPSECQFIVKGSNPVQTLPQTPQDHMWCEWDDFVMNDIARVLHENEYYWSYSTSDAQWLKGSDELKQYTDVLKNNSLMKERASYWLFEMRRLLNDRPDARHEAEARAKLTRSEPGSSTAVSTLRDSARWNQFAQTVQCA